MINLGHYTSNLPVVEFETLDKKLCVDAKVRGRTDAGKTIALVSVASPQIFASWNLRDPSIVYRQVSQP